MKTNSSEKVLLGTIHLSLRIHNWTQQETSISILALLHRVEMEGAVGLGGDAGRERPAVGHAVGMGKERAGMARVLVAHVWRG